MNCLYILVVIPLIAGQVLVQPTSGIPGTQCGGVICMEGNNSTCILERNECRCNQGFVGNGRFACVDEAKSCLCYLYGDPHVTAFSNSLTCIDLPCNHVLAEFTTPTGIRVKVSGMTIQRNERNYPGFVFEDGLLIQARKRDTVSNALCKRDGFWDKGLKVKLPFSAQMPDFGIYCSGDTSQYWRFELVGEGVVIRYRSADSSVTIQAPRDSEFVGFRPCGRCQDNERTYMDQARAAGLTESQWSLSNVFGSLDPAQDANPECKALNDAYQGCSTAQRQQAIKFCGAPYSNHQIGECFTERHGKARTLTLTKDCINEFCAGRTIDWCRTCNDVRTRCSNQQVDFREVTDSCGQ